MDRGQGRLAREKKKKKSLANTRSRLIEKAPTRRRASKREKLADRSKVAAGGRKRNAVQAVRQAASLHSSSDSDHSSQDEAEAQRPRPIVFESFIANASPTRGKRTPQKRPASPVALAPEVDEGDQEVDDVNVHAPESPESRGPSSPFASSFSLLSPQRRVPKPVGKDELVHAIFEELFSRRSRRRNIYAVGGETSCSDGESDVDEVWIKKGLEAAVLSTVSAAALAAAGVEDPSMRDRASLLRRFVDPGLLYRLVEAVRHEDPRVSSPRISILRAIYRSLPSLRPHFAKALVCAAFDRYDDVASTAKAPTLSSRGDEAQFVSGDHAYDHSQGFLDVIQFLVESLGDEMRADHEARVQFQQVALSPPRRAHSRGGSSSEESDGSDSEAPPRQRAPSSPNISAVLLDAVIQADEELEELSLPPQQSPEAPWGEGSESEGDPDEEASGPVRAAAGSTPTRKQARGRRRARRESHTEASREQARSAFERAAALRAEQHLETARNLSRALVLICRAHRAPPAHSDTDFLLDGVGQLVSHLPFAAPDLLTSLLRAWPRGDGDLTVVFIKLVGRVLSAAPRLDLIRPGCQVHVAVFKKLVSVLTGQQARASVEVMTFIGISSTAHNYLMVFPDLLRLCQEALVKNRTHWSEGVREISEETFDTLLDFC